MKSIVHKNEKNMPWIATWIIRKLHLSNAPWIMWTYIIFDFILSFFVTFVFFIVIFIFNQILLYAKDILEISIPVAEVGKLLLFKIPEILSLSIPFATLVACLMSVGGFSSHNEFVAMRSVGISFFNTFVPYAFIAFFIVIFSFFTVEVLRPLGSIYYAKQYQKVLSLNPQLGLRSSSVTKYQDDIIAIQTVDGSAIDGLIIIDTDSDENNRTIVASRALVDNSLKGVISLDLYDVLSISNEEKPTEYSYIQSKKMVYNLLLKDITQEVLPKRIDDKSIKDIVKTIHTGSKENIFVQELQKAKDLANIRATILDSYEAYALFEDTKINQQNHKDTFNSNVKNNIQRYADLQQEQIIVRDIHNFKVVLYKKLSFIVVPFLFIFIAFPIGLFYKRSGKSIGFGTGLILSFFYWFFIILLQGIAINTFTVSPFIMIWLPNFAVLVLGIILLYVKRLF